MFMSAVGVYLSSLSSVRALVLLFFALCCLVGTLAEPPQKIFHKQVYRKDLSPEAQPVPFKNTHTYNPPWKFANF